MSKPINFIRLFKASVKSAKEKCGYMYVQDYEIDVDIAWDRMAHGLMLCEKTLRKQYMGDGKVFTEFAKKFRMCNIPYINDKYGGHTLYKLLMSMADTDRIEFTNLFGNLFYIIKKTHSERRRIRNMLDAVSAKDKTLQGDIMLKFKEEIIKIYHDNKFDYNNLILEYMAFWKRNVGAIQTYIRVFIDIINEDLIGYTNGEGIIPLEMIDEIEGMVTTGNLPELDEMIELLTKIMGLLTILPRPTPSGKYESISKLIHAVVKQTKNVKLKNLFKPKAVNNIESFVEMILFPLTTGVVADELRRLSDIFVRPVNTTPIEFAKHIIATTDPLTVVKGLIIHKNPPSIESTDEAMWSSVFCDTVNTSITTRVAPTDIGSLLTGTYIYNIFINIGDKFIESINKQFGLNYNYTYIQDIIEVVLS